MQRANAQRVVGIVGMAAGVIVGSVLTVQAAAPEARPVTRTSQWPRFEALSRAHLDATRPDAERKKVEALLKDIAGETKRLRGQGLTPGKLFDESVYSRLHRVLTEAVRHCGIALAASIALDAHRDDVVRQAAWLVLIENDAKYQSADLPVLCRVFMASTTVEDTPGFPPRAWITAPSLRTRVARPVARLCRISDLFHEKGDLSLSSLHSKPTVWLRSALEHGIAKAKDPRDAAIMAGCLLSIE